MSELLYRVSILFGMLLLFIAAGLSQEPSRTPSVEEEPIKISTEEVNLNVRVQSMSQSPAPQLAENDLLIVDNGIPQDITKIQKLPANVLLLLDTGAEINYVKSLRTTRLVAEAFIYGLQKEDSLAITQYYDKIETIYDWGNDYPAAIKAVNTKLYTGRRSRFADAVNEAIISFRMRPAQNRHLVIISDGAETSASDVDRRKALQDLVAANITVHFISYTRLEEEFARRAVQRFRLGDGKTTPRVDPLIWDDIVRGLYISNAVGLENAAKFEEHLKMLNSSQALVKIDLDLERNRQIRKRREDWQVKEPEMQTLAEETGGLFSAPETTENLFRAAIETANAVDSYYIVTYIPKSNPADSAVRKVRVSTSLNGIKVESRHKILMSR
jgi:VWFA-related protein